MNRTLRRPMFRIGGVAEGITSGLAPRQGYQGTGEAWDQFVKAVPGIKEQAKAAAYRPSRPGMSEFLINFGLDIASRPPSGSIFSTAAAAAKDPYTEWQKAKREADLQEYASESDMFKTMLGSYGDIMAAEAEGKAEGKGWLEQWKFKQIPELNKKIADLTKKQDNGTITDDESLELENSIDQKSRIVSLDPVTEAWLKTKDGGYAVVDMKTKILKEDQKLPEDERKYTGDRDIQLTIDAIAAVKRQLGLAEGGRVGYQIGGDVMPGQPMQAAGPTDQAAEAPPEVQNIDYETLRARLPNTITDDIVRLIASSAEAMEDFATIQTQQDINNFNEKYGVELVLPAEA